MRVAVVGTGGIGAPYGASLAKAGVDVTFVARGAHLAAIRENGLRVEGDRGETHVRPARATDNIASIGTVDFALLCVKLWDVETSGRQLRPIVGPKTAVVPLQNGVDAAERLIPILGCESVMGGTAYVTGNISSPGVIRQTGTYQRMTFGELDGRLSERGRQLSALCETAGFEGVLSPDIRVPLWEKFNLLVPTAGVNALTRLPLGKWREDSDLLALYETALQETVAVGRAEGVRLPPESDEKARTTMWSMPPYLMTSLATDLLRGNRLELPWLTGKVVELGRRYGVPTPVNGFIYAALKPYINGTPA
jgi:2-dehydropantoate 2-reductase